MNDNLTQREQLSALADGQLQGEALAQALEFAEQEEGMATWKMYHLVGDVLRSPELARPADDGAFLRRLQQQLALEPSPLRAAPERWAPVAVSPERAATEAANAPFFGWKMVAGFASLAVVAAVGWNAWSDIQGAGIGAQLAAAPAAVQTAVAEAEGGAAPVMIRDPRLDELLAAHKQFGGTSALQMPAGFLRNATFEAPAR